jgi:CRP-like cAMP-binding protein
MIERRADLADVPFFSSLNAAVLDRVRAVAEERVVPTGTIVCRRGDEGQAVWVVASGGVAVRLDGVARPGMRRIFLGPGEIFGEMSILDSSEFSLRVAHAARS